MLWENKMDGICRICGLESSGVDFDSWVKDTFTNYDLLHPGNIICNACVFWFDQRSAQLQNLMGKDKPQKMQNYSHFVVDGEWIPVGKGNKARMAELLLGKQFPELAVIAVSGQKQLAFRARRNVSGRDCGWVQFEEKSIWVEQSSLKEMIFNIEQLYSVFSKGEIETGHYYPSRIIDFGMERWKFFEDKIKPARKTALFQLSLFLAQRSDDGTGEFETSGSGDDALDLVEGNSPGLQEQIPDDDLGAVRERDQSGSIHQQADEVRQLNFFENAD